MDGLQESLHFQNCEQDLVPGFFFFFILGRGVGCFHQLLKCLFMKLDEEPLTWMVYDLFKPSNFMILAWKGTL